MKTLIIFFLAISFAFLCRADELVEASWFPQINGISSRGEYIDLNTNNTERLYIRYCPAADEGVELERTTNNVVIWRVHVQPLGIDNSKYDNEVNVRIREDEIYVTSIGGVDLLIENGEIHARNFVAKKFFEVRSLKTGALISRKVSDVPPLH